MFKEVVIEGMLLHGTALGHCQLQHSFIAKCDRSFEEKGNECFSPHVIDVLKTQTRERVYFLELVHKGVPSTIADQILPRSDLQIGAVPLCGPSVKLTTEKGLKRIENEPKRAKHFMFLPKKLRIWGEPP